MASEPAGNEVLVGCRCNEVTELYGEEAAAYADEHLHAGGVVDELVCPDTGMRWRLDESDADQPRLVAVGGP